MNVLFFGLLAIGMVDPKVAQAQDQIVASRQKIATLHIRFRSEYRGKGRVLDRDTTIWFSPRGTRRDERLPYGQGGLVGLPIDPQKDPASLFRNVTCRKGREVISYVDADLAGDHAISLSIRDTSVVDDHGSFEISDIRLLGLVPYTCANLTRTSLANVFARGDRLSGVVDFEDWKGIPCERITEQFANGTSRRMWVDPNRANIPLRVEFIGKHEQFVECEYTYVDNPGIWFPRRCEYRKLLGDDLLVQETITVSELSLNTPIEDDVFSLKGMEIKAGTPVSKLPPESPEGHSFWNGTEIAVRDAGPAFNSRPMRSEGSAWVSWILLANGAVLACVAMYFLLRAIRPRPTLP